MALDHTPTTYSFGNCELDVRLHEFRRDGQPRAMEPQVFDLLAHLIENRHRLVDKDELNAKIWRGRFVSDASLTTVIKQARQAIGDNGKQQALIKTLPRRGFRFVGAIRDRDGARAAPPDKQKIAALPFENMSSDPEQAYFADGMTDDLITHLSKIEGLFVISRNSVFTYKGRNVKVETIARDLGVRYVLEGSVRRAGETVRINAQLIDAESGDHVWAELFDRALADIFALQDDVVGEIIVALKLKLTKDAMERLAPSPTINLAAYERVLKARDIHFGFQIEGMTKAVALYRQAQTLDPEYADAFAGEAAAAFDHWLTAYRKGGAPEWPYGFQCDEGNRLNGAELSKLMLGHRVEGNGQRMGAYALDIAPDGRWTYSDQNIRFSGRAWVEDDQWRHVTDGSASGRVFRLPFYRNPTGSRARLNEYIHVDCYDIFWFSVTA